MSALMAGLLVGFAECLLFALTLARRPFDELALRFWGADARPLLDGTGSILVVGAPVLAGIAYGWLLYRRRADSKGSVWLHSLIGPLLLGSSICGLVVAASLEPLALRQDDAGRLLVFRIAFTSASGIAALLCSFATGVTLGRPRSVIFAVRIASVTAATYLVYLLAIEQLPGWHVGGGNMAMPRVAMLGNLIAGTVGGALAFQALQRGRHQPAAEDP